MLQRAQAFRIGPATDYMIGIAFFCGMDAVMKHLVADTPVVTATFWRYVVAVFFLAAMWLHAGRPTITPEMLRVHALRGALVAASATSFFWALTRLKLAETVTIAFIAPLMFPPFAALLLKEQMRPRNIVAGIIGFAGVLVAVVGTDVQALTEERLQGALAVLLSAVAYALSAVMMRDRAQKDHGSIVGLLGAAYPMLLLLPFALFTSGPIVPGAGDWGWYLLVGLFGAAALQFYARAFAHAQAQVLAPLEYTALPWAALFGWAFFSEPVGWQTWAGAAIIIAACLWSQQRQRPGDPAAPA